MEGNYLIPANTSRGKLIFGLFRTVDLIIFSIGVGITFILLMILPMESTVVAIIALAPALVCSLLVAPLPYYHNVLTFIIEVHDYLTSQQRYKWKGWCFIYGTEDDRKNNGGLDPRLAGNQQRNDSFTGPNQSNRG